MTQPKPNLDHLYRVRRHFVVNNGDGVDLDKDLRPIVIRLPEPPDNWNNIKNYGLHPDDQIYRPDEVPIKLRKLEKEVVDKAVADRDRTRNNVINGYSLLKKYWDALEEHSEKYEEEIKWMRHVIWKRYYGEWVFIDGQLLWFPPRYYMYLNWWFMNVEKGYARPEFRIRDWKSACMNHYLRHTGESFARLTKKGKAQKEPNGTWRVRDMGSRVMYGSIRPKNRRSGATHEAMNECHETVCTQIGTKATAISKSVTDVQEFFDEMLYPAWSRQPMFLHPTWMGARPDGQRIEYKAPTGLFGIPSMDSVIYYIKTTDEVAIDSKRLDCILLDEQGKPTGGGRVNVSDRWGISKQTLSTGDGANIHGFALNPSTAEEMEDGAKQYKDMCDRSDFYRRAATTGQTTSGLTLVYFPAQYCLEGFVDCFGKAVIGDPTERQIELTRKHFPNGNHVFVERRIGAKEHLLGNRQQLLTSGKPEDLSAYRKLVRKHPMKYAESWIGDSGDMGFPVIKIDARLAEEESDPVRWIDHGHFQWTQGFGSPVVWVPGDEDDRFELSMRMDYILANRRRQVRVFNGKSNQWELQFAPIDPKIIIGVDTFGFDNKQLADQRDDKSRKSDGGIGAYYPFDLTVDDPNKPLEWVSDRFVLSYRYKPVSTDAFNEDILMAAMYFNAWVYPERNITNTWEYFIDKGYGGYLKYDVNMSTGKLESKPGYWLGLNLKQDMLGMVASYLDRNTHREKHTSFLKECKNIRGPEELKNYDRLAAHGAALWGSRDMDITSKVKDNSDRVQKAYAQIGVSL